MTVTRTVTKQRGHHRPDCNGRGKVRKTGMTSFLVPQMPKSPMKRRFSYTNVLGLYYDFCATLCLVAPFAPRCAVCVSLRLLRRRLLVPFWKREHSKTWAHREFHHDGTTQGDAGQFLQKDGCFWLTVLQTSTLMQKQVQMELCLWRNSVVKFTGKFHLCGLFTSMRIFQVVCSRGPTLC